MGEWVFDPAKAGKYIREIARDQNSEERMNLERIGDALLAIGGKALPTVPSRDAPILIVDERNGKAVAIEATAIELVEANGEPHAKVTVPDGFVLLDRDAFEALGGAPNPAPNPVDHPQIDVLVSDGFAAIVGATYEGLDQTGSPVYQLKDGATIHPAQTTAPQPLAADLANKADPAGVSQTLGDAYNVKADG